MRRDCEDDEEFEPQRSDGPEAVENWFDLSSRKRMQPHRLHGVTPNWLLGDLVRTGDSRRTSASMTPPTREPDDRAPGQGEWHGPTFKMRSDVGRRNEGPERESINKKEQEEALRRELEDFGEVLGHVREDPYYRHQMLTQFVDGFYGFNDRSREGRRHRPTDDQQLLEGPQAPHPHRGPVDESRYRSR